MTMLTEAVDHVIGVDPDRDRLTIAVIDTATTGVLARTVVGADPAGYRQALAFAAVHSSVDRRVWSIEGAGSYGAGLAQVAATAGERVVGFDRPEGRAAKDGAKSDALDAVRAARELLGRDQWAQPRARGAREAIRVLSGCRDSAHHDRQQVAELDQNLDAADAYVAWLEGRPTASARLAHAVETLSQVAHHAPSFAIDAEDIDKTRWYQLLELAPDHLEHRDAQRRSIGEVELGR